MPRSECSLLNLSEIIFTELADKPQLTLTLFIQLTDFASGQADRFLGEERLHKTNLSAASVIDPVNKRFKYGLKKKNISTFSEIKHVVYKRCPNV